LARGIAFRLAESFGSLKRETIADMMKSLDQEARAQLRKYGVRFGAFSIYFPALLKPAAAELAATLWALKHAGEHGLTLETLPEMPRAGLTSAVVVPTIPEAYYRTYGFHVCGPRAIRLDILERLADLIRPLLAWRQQPGGTNQPPKGATGDGGFTVTPEMMSILGCSPDELGGVLKALGFRLDRRPVDVTSNVAKPVNGDAAASVAPPAEAEPVALTDAATAASPPEVSSAPEAPAEQAPGPVVDDASLPAIAPDAEAPASEAAAPAEPQMIDIWRPRRHRQGEDRPHGRNRDQDAQGAERKERGDRGRRDRDRRPRNGGQGHTPRQDAPPAAPSQVAASATAQPAAEAATPSQRPPRHEDKPRPQHQRADRNNNSRDRDRGRGDRDKQGRNEHRSGDRRRPQDEQRPMMRSSASPARKGGVDPDSPFASLGALREALEKQAREKNP
jgi:ATP-dependent RNA helicase SUPV3L1/SUV3